MDLVPLLDRLRAQLAERRASGIYPDGLEDELDAHARRVASHRLPPENLLAKVREKLDAARSRRTIAFPAPTSSGLPLGSALHRLIARVQARQMEGVIRQVDGWTHDVEAALEAMFAVLEAPAAHAHPEIASRLDAILDRMAAAERMGADVATANLAERIAHLERTGTGTNLHAPFDNAAFEARFRGSEEDLRTTYAALAERLSGPVLDIGCGQGVFVQQCQERSLDVRGVELDEGLATMGAAAGLPVEHGDGLAALRACDDGSLGAVVLLQVVEHLGPQGVCDLILLAALKLRPGGVLAMDTVNPQSLYVFARAFYVDPTHTTPVHPAYLEFLCNQGGFAQVEIDWHSPVSQDEALVDDGTENTARLNRLLFGPQDYLLLATR